MAGLLASDPSFHSTQDTAHKCFVEKTEESDRWYFSRKEIEENSPSQVDGIDLKKETYLRKSYCTFLQDLGMRLKVPQVTIATAILFCHRFFLHHSHAKNDRRTIATVCMFLAGKVEETPRPLKDVIMVSYEIIHKKDPVAGLRIKQKEVYEQQKELILVGERVVLATLGFDLTVYHPYKPLVEAIKRFNVAKSTLAQVAWNFVNDGLRTSLCLQFRSHHIAAGAIFLAAKFLKVRLPSEGDRVWWTEFDVTPRQLEEVSNQMLELYEQNRVPAALASQGSEAEGSVMAEASKPLPAPIQDNNDSHTPNPAEASDETQNPRKEENSGNEHRRSTMEVCGMKSFDKEKVKATMKQRKLLLRNVTRRKDALMDEDDLIEKELEDGIEIAAAAERGGGGGMGLGFSEGEVSDGSRSPNKRKAGVGGLMIGNHENDRNVFGRHGTAKRQQAACTGNSDLI